MNLLKTVDAAVGKTRPEVKRTRLRGLFRKV